MSKLTNQGTQIVNVCAVVGIVGGCLIQWSIPELHGVVMGAIFGASGAVVGQLFGRWLAFSLGYSTAKQPSC